MKNNWKWIIGIVVGLLVLFALPSVFRSFGGFGMMGGYGSGFRHSMMGGFNFMHFGGAMGSGMLLAWIIPLGLLFGVVYGAVRLATKANGNIPSPTCSECGQEVQADWKNCPYCGTGL